MESTFIFYCEVFDDKLIKIARGVTAQEHLACTL